VARFWTSDLHFGHANIIRYCHRPFADVETMDRALVDRWNAVVTADDEVWVLGDVAMGPIDHSLGLVRELAGRKVLVTGNHDRCWSGHGAKALPWVDRYREAGFDEILHGAVETTLGGRDILCSHFPYRGDSHDEERFLEHRPADTGKVLLHGHVHDRWRACDRQINVGVDVWDYRPVSDDEILAVIA
jgi:calcineurin-like phosphoesterase family protein